MSKKKLNELNKVIKENWPGAKELRASKITIIPYGGRKHSATVIPLEDICNLAIHIKENAKYVKSVNPKESVFFPYNYPVVMFNKKYKTKTAKNEDDADIIMLFGGNNIGDRFGSDYSLYRTSVPNEYVEDEDDPRAITSEEYIEFVDTRDPYVLDYVINQINDIIKLYKKRILLDGDLPIGGNEIMAPTAFAKILNMLESEDEEMKKMAISTFPAYSYNDNKIEFFILSELHSWAFSLRGKGKYSNYINSRLQEEDDLNIPYGDNLELLIGLKLKYNDKECIDIALNNYIKRTLDINYDMIFDIRKK